MTFPRAHPNPHRGDLNKAPVVDAAAGWPADDVANPHPAARHSTGRRSRFGRRSYRVGDPPAPGTLASNPGRHPLETASRLLGSADSRTGTTHQAGWHPFPESRPARPFTPGGPVPAGCAWVWGFGHLEMR